MKRKLIIDVDTGVDDAQALMLALSRPDFEVMGITCVAGSTKVDQVCINTLKVLKVCNRLDIPVYKGSAKSLLGTGSVTDYHGSDGLGDVGHLVDANPNNVQSEHAVLAMVRLVNQFPGEITLVALAPLTNVALALRVDPDFGKKLHSVTIMGGNIQGRGNLTLCAEFNFAADPEAAFVVLSEMGRKLTLFPLEINLTDDAGYPWEWYNDWIKTDTFKGKFNRNINQRPAEILRRKWHMPVYTSCDLSAMATVVNDDTVLEMQDVYATVELAGTLSRGMMVVDWEGTFDKEPNLRVIKRMDTQKARNMFHEMVND